MSIEREMAHQWAMAEQKVIWHMHSVERLSVTQIAERMGARPMQIASQLGFLKKAFSLYRNGFFQNTTDSKSEDANAVTK